MKLEREREKERKTESEREKEPKEDVLIQSTRMEREREGSLFPFRD